MEEDLAKRSVKNAISRGDVETLVVLYYSNPSVRELINESTEEVAHINGFDGTGLSFKEFVVNVYDPKQARKAYRDGNSLTYLKEGGIARARDIAIWLEKDITRCGNLIAGAKHNIDILVQILHKLKGEYCPLAETISNALIRDSDREKFIKLYIDHGYPKFNSDVIVDILNYLLPKANSERTAGSAINLLLKKRKFSHFEKVYLVRLVKSYTQLSIPSIKAWIGDEELMYML